MTRLQTVLLLTVAALAALFIGRVLWEPVTLPLLDVLGHLPSLGASALRSVPEWVWWTLVSSIWWLPFVVGKKAPWGCRSASCSSRPSAA